MSDVGDTSPDEENSSSNRERLLDAAIALAGRHGLESVTYRAVATRAGLAHGMVRHYFGSRERLLQEAFERASERDATEVILNAKSIDTFALPFVEVMNQNWERPVMQFDEAISALRGVMPRANVLRQYRGYLEDVAATLEAIGVKDPDGSWAALIFAALDGMTLQHLLYESDERTEAVLKRLREILAFLASQS